MLSNYMKVTLVRPACPSYFSSVRSCVEAERVPSMLEEQCLQEVVYTVWSLQMKELRQFR